MLLRTAATGIGLISAALLGGCTGANPHLPVNDPIMEAVFPGDPAMHPSPPGPFVNGKPYTVTIKTGNLDKAGTDANVYIAFEGTKDDSEDILLENPQRDNFERGHADDFHFDYRDVGKIKAPLMIHYAALDDRINAGWPAYEAALKANGIKYEMYMYPGTNHGFHNDTTPRYDEAAAKLAWQRTVDFFNKNVRSS